jgi:hypothetical protein
MGTMKYQNKHGGNLLNATVLVHVARSSQVEDRRKETAALIYLKTAVWVLYFVMGASI